MGVLWQGQQRRFEVGLPLQSVHDGESGSARPLRLGVLIEAATPQN